MGFMTIVAIIVPSSYVLCNIVITGKGLYADEIPAYSPGPYGGRESGDRYESD
jgi:hypothetical protein